MSTAECEEEVSLFLLFAKLAGLRSVRERRTLSLLPEMTVFSIVLGNVFMNKRDKQGAIVEKMRENCEDRMRVGFLLYERSFVDLQVPAVASV